MLPAAVALSLCLSAARVHAALITFTGLDPGAGSLTTAPNAVAAAASFDTAAALLGSETLINFESSPLGTFTSLTPAPGVTITGTEFGGGPQSIVDRTFCTNPKCGYNTTPGGAQFLQLFGGNATFSFNPGTSAFGAYVTGVQLAGETITFDDGSSQSIAIPDPGSSGGTDFIGFTDAGRLIASLLINVQFATASDIIGVDDVRYLGVSAPPVRVPEPSTFAIYASSLIGLGFLLWRGWRRRA